MTTTNTDRDRDALDLLWHRLGRDETDVKVVLRELILVMRMQLRRIDELQAEVNLMRQEKETGK